MRIAILGSQVNQREQGWLDRWADEFTRIGTQVSINPDLSALEQAQVLVLLFDGRATDPYLYTALGYFYQLKASDSRSPVRLTVALAETEDFPASLTPFFDHVTRTEKGLINTVKDYLYLSHRHVNR
jgi:hypothetical protein